ncbi:MAG: glycosyltransferase family 4 protein [Planctomycetales bacterium]|nr:glycosyltransferase family 4 protein [Planctomycetales bacterium]
MRTLHLYSGNLYGGIERLLVTIAQTQQLPAACEHEFALCFDGRLQTELQSCGAKVHTLGQVRFRQPWTLWLANQRLRQILRREYFDNVVTHSAWVHAAFAGTVRRDHQSNLIFWKHDTPDRVHWSDRLASRHTPDASICNSHYTRSQTGHMFLPHPNHVVYLPVAQRALPTAKRQEVRRSLQIATDEVVMLIACRLERWKGHSLLLESLSQMDRSRPWRLLVAGGVQKSNEACFLNDLQEMVRSRQLQDRIQFLGQRDDVETLMHAADLYVQPNLRPEPFGIVFVEAMLAGLPVVSTKLGGAAELIDNSCGVLVKADATELSVALQQLICDPILRKRLAMGGPARATALCEPMRQLRQIENVIHSVRRSA